jgi:hypothetical protein
MGYRLWASTDESTTEQISAPDAFASAFSQSGFADDLAGGEVEE